MRKIYRIIIRSLKPIVPVEYGMELISYTIMYLLKNAETVHELSFKNNSEIEVYKILKKLSKLKGMKIVRFKDYFKLGNIKIEVLNSKELRVNDVIMKIENFKISLPQKFKVGDCSYRALQSHNLAWSLSYISCIHITKRVFKMVGVSFYPLKFNIFPTTDGIKEKPVLNIFNRLAIYGFKII